MHSPSKNRLSEITANFTLAILLLIAILLLPARSRGAVWHPFASYNEVLDSLRLVYVKIYDTERDTIFDTVWTSVYRYDSSLYFNPGTADTAYTLTIYPYWPGVTVAKPVVFSTEDGIARDSITIPFAFEAGEADSVVERFIRSGTVIQTNRWPAPSGELSVTHALIADHHYTAAFETYFTNDTLPMGGCVFANTIETADSGTGSFLPAPVSGSKWVTAYIDLSDGSVNSGSFMNPRKNVTLTLSLEGATTLWLDSTAIVPKTYSAPVDTTGRATFMIPVNSFLTPKGSYFRLEWRAKDGYSISSGTIKKFVVDSIPDPVNIANTKEVY